MPFNAGNVEADESLEKTCLHRVFVVAGHAKYNKETKVVATLLYGLCMNDAFENGNKRTALVTSQHAAVQFSPPEAAIGRSVVANLSYMA